MKLIKSPVPLVVGLLLILPRPLGSIQVDQLAPTVHAPLAGSVEEMWFVPSDAERKPRRSVANQSLADGVEAFGAGDYARAATLVSTPGLAKSELRDWAAYYRGLSELKLAKASDARATFAGIRARKVGGHLSVGAALGEAEAAETLGDAAAAAAIYDELAAEKSTTTDEVLLKLGRAAVNAGDRRKAAAAFIRVRYEYPLSEGSTEAATALMSLQDVVERKDFKADLGRAAVLFGARRYDDARDAYSQMRSAASGDDRELVELRIAECDYFLGHHKAALDGLVPFTEQASRRAEARFFHASATRELGRTDDYVAQTRSLVAEFSDSSWSEEALNNLGTHYILTNRDDLAADVFRELYEKFPTSVRAERAAWKHGWWSYKNGEYAAAVRTFEAAARSFPRSDYRPSFLYWAARAHAKLGVDSQAESRLSIVYSDYGSSYYGRLALLHLPKGVKTTLTSGTVPASAPAATVRAEPPANIEVIRQLLSNELFDDAISELRFAQRTSGASPALDATIAWAYNQKGELRRAITLMRRAYPQHLTSGGQDLPVEILQVIYPLTYWDSIRKHSAARNLDPYVVAALIAQESTFDPKARSAANAWGLMQVIPSTGRRLARSLGIRRFSTPMLTDPEINLRLGTLYFSRLIEQFGGSYYALASYNAGESRVVRWKAERPGIEQDEFIDDIPFPE
ncbi:MAG TPA: transglycosylase SLT domain-containing protein, partial [Steroidobacter sp.]|nr:transglycosylase SLT domain-containing protein [Steroidobacter sp.]